MTVEPENKTVHFNQLDGLRGVAIIIVVLSHCDILNQGGVANALFFAIAGFLLINPFKDEYENRFLSIRSILKFYKSRALRILPGYYLVLLFIYLQTGFNLIPKSEFLNLLFFFGIYRHLWFISTYFWLMIIIPFVFAGLLLLAKIIKPLNNDIVCAVVFLILAALFRFVLLPMDQLYIRIDQLMLGICAGYIFRFIRKSNRFKSVLGKKTVIGDLILIFLFSLIFLSSNVVLGLINTEWSNFLIGWNFFYLVGCFMSLLVILICLFPNGIVGRILSSKILLFIGKLSFTIYLLNNFVIDQINVSSKYCLFICAFSVCVVLAWIIDTVISKVISVFKTSTSVILNKHNNQ